MRKALTFLYKPPADNRAELLFGQAVEVTASFYVKGPDYDSSLQPYPYDPKRQKRFLNRREMRKDTKAVTEYLMRTVKVFFFRFMYARTAK